MLYSTQVLYCPVCKSRLGARTKAHPFEELCNDCDFYYYFPPNATKPSKVTSRKSKENICACSNCEDRRLHEK